MKTKNILFLLVLLIMIGQQTLAQSNRAYILAQTDTAALKRLAADLDAAYHRDHAAALRKALEMGWDTVNLVRLKENGDPFYVKPTNNAAATLTGTISARTKLATNGQGMVVGMWEAQGAGTSTMPLDSHQDFGNRILIVESTGNSTASSHATHVAGTLIGQPPVSGSQSSRGMATQATLRSRSSANDISEMATEAANGMLVSNHSYGPRAGWDNDGTQNSGPPWFEEFKQWTWFGGAGQYNSNGDDPQFGTYDVTARNIDELCINAPFYLPVWAAGNDHTDNPVRDQVIPLVHDQVRNGTGGTYADYDPAIHPKGDGFQVCNVSGGGLALNGLTIGSMTKTGGISEFSSRGPGDDGRMLPHLCGIGTDIYSAWNTGNNSYETNSGTSMATPNVAGSLLILQDGYEQLHGAAGTYMRAATLKALAIHTAAEVGNTGPDYTWGWGQLNADKAADVINEDGWKTPTSRHRIIESTIPTSGTSHTFFLNFSGTEELRVTLGYADPVDLNSLTPLQNDLDVRVEKVAPPMTTYFPYVLNPNNPSAAATKGDNDIENVEQVRETVSAGLYTVTVFVEGNLYNNAPQPYSLIISGLNPNCHYMINHDEDVSLASGQYNSSTTIQSSATVEANKSVIYQAPESIVLKPGFHAKQNSFFKTVRADCF